MVGYIRCLGGIRVNVFLFLLLIFFFFGCSDDVVLKKEAEAGVLYAPLSKEEISKIIVVGMSRNDLIERCGTPMSIRNYGEFDDLEFFISSDNLKSGSGRHIGSFIVTLSNDCVVVWWPDSTVQVR